MTIPLHIIEPTLEGATGHCFSFVNSLFCAAGDTPITLWCGRNADVLFPKSVLVKCFFFRRLRKLQVLWLYRTLLRQPGRMLVPTAGKIDLLLLDLAASGTIPAGKVFLYVHWFKTSPTRRRQLKKLATSQPEISILAPTTSVCEEFISAGFARTRHIPYPITPLSVGTLSEEGHVFRHVLFAGGARRDKGFGNVVDFVELLAATGRDIPVTLQTSPQHYDKMDEVAVAGLARLDRLIYPHLKCHADTLQHLDYSALFAGAICLQLYSYEDFADRVSGVTLDALSMGCPVVTLAGTWIDRVVSEFDAGVVIKSPTPDTVLDAVIRIISDYEQYSSRAFLAGRELLKRNSAEFLFRELMQ